jgi:hypothetical protein
MAGVKTSAIKAAAEDALDDIRVIPAAGVVACLAPGRPDHTFWSTDVKRDRWCKKCRARLRREGLPAAGPRLYDPEGR